MAVVRPIPRAGGPHVHFRPIADGSPVSREADSRFEIETSRPRQTERPAAGFREVLAGGVSLLMSGAEVATHVVGRSGAGGRGSRRPCRRGGDPGDRTQTRGRGGATPDGGGRGNDARTVQDRATVTTGNFRTCSFWPCSSTSSKKTSAFRRSPTSCARGTTPPRPRSRTSARDVLGSPLRGTRQSQLGRAAALPPITSAPARTTPPHRSPKVSPPRRLRRRRASPTSCRRPVRWPRDHRLRSRAPRPSWPPIFRRAGSRPGRRSTA